jgi:hypothetical protein
MPIDTNSAMEEYKSRTSQAGTKLVSRYRAATNKLARATSDAAQNAYKAAMSDPKVLERRRSNLRKLSEEDLNRNMELKGASAYSAGTSAGADKWGRNFAPYASVIDSTTASLPERTRDPVANVTNRVIPLAKNLRAKKDSMS